MRNESHEKRSGQQPEPISTSKAARRAAGNGAPLVVEQSLALRTPVKETEPSDCLRVAEVEPIAMAMATFNAKRRRY